MEELKKLLTPYQFYFETALYKKITFEEAGYLSIDLFVSNMLNGTINASSITLEGDTTYLIEFKNSYFFSQNFYEVWLTCKRTDSRNIVFYIYRQKDCLIKIGQFPSYADLQKIDKAFQKELSQEDRNNYSKAIGLFSHGANIGAYSYLRRIFENIIWKCYTSNIQSVKMIEDDFRKLNMSDKINTLKDFLPQPITKFKMLYGIISKGIHELSEDECGKYFSPLKTVIDLAIKENIKIKQEIKDKENLERELQKITSELSGN
jgi:hypothetical protein